MGNNHHLKTECDSIKKCSFDGSFAHFHIKASPEIPSFAVARRKDNKISKSTDVRKFNFDSIPIDPFWNMDNAIEMKMHRIHGYPAKFPAFITTKALIYAKRFSIKPKLIADVFCGCGTVAFESKRNGINFWGCDINPVATMIARTKSQTYNSRSLERYFDSIIAAYDNSVCRRTRYVEANKRLKYWYDDNQLEKLSKLKAAIESVVPKNSKYRLFFTCAFSNILKATSRWLTKSIKPQIDPNKKPADVMNSFKQQYRFMTTANDQVDMNRTSSTKIISGNILSKSIACPKVDMIITSPPYVTSYEYADLHQLSALWLDYAMDYRELRDGSIGSLYHVYNFDKDLKRLNNAGSSVVFRLLLQNKAQAKSVAKYFLDMQRAAKVCHSILLDKGLAVFVIGDTEYRGVRIENARHLSESLLDSGFRYVYVTKRKITGKILTPYRDELGRFTSDDSSRKVYGEEFIIIGRK